MPILKGDFCRILSSSNFSHLYDNVGVGYDNTRRPDPYIAERLAHHLGLPDGEVFLDLACGTGNYTDYLAGQNGTWHGIDQSRRMIKTAREKSERVSWYLGDVTALPFADSAFSGVLCSLAIHHFPDISQAFAEAYRVLNKGNFVIFTATPEQTRGYWLNEFFPDAMAKSIEKMPPLALMEEALVAAGFRLSYTEPYEVRPDLQDFFLYSAKHRPQMYLSETVRKGISTFALWADPVEVATGCARLRREIQSGRIVDIIRAYTHELGDYMFVVATKHG